MKELELKYGCNPNQKPSRVFMKDRELPFKVLNGKPGYINLLDAMNSWQLVRELKQATGLPAAASSSPHRRYSRAKYAYMSLPPPRGTPVAVPGLA